MGHHLQASIEVGSGQFVTGPQGMCACPKPNHVCDVISKAGALGGEVGALGCQNPDLNASYEL